MGKRPRVSTKKVIKMVKKWRFYHFLRVRKNSQKWPFSSLFEDFSKSSKSAIFSFFIKNDNFYHFWGQTLFFKKVVKMTIFGSFDPKNGHFWDFGENIVFKKGQKPAILPSFLPLQKSLVLGMIPKKYPFWQKSQWAISSPRFAELTPKLSFSEVQNDNFYHFWGQTLFLKK